MRNPHLDTLVKAILLVAALVTAAAKADGPLSADAALQDIAIARSTIEHLHAGYDRYTPEPELAAMWNALEDRAQQGIERGQLYLGLSRILASIRCDHTKAELAADLEAERDTRALYLPFRFVLFDERMYVETAIPGTGLERGDEILSIDGHDVDWWLQRIGPLVPVDGDAVHARPLEIAYSTEFMGSALDHFAPFVTHVGETVTLRFRRPGAAEREITVPRQTYSDFQAMVGEERYSANFSDGVRFQPIGDHAAYLAVDTFVNYRKPVDAMAHLAPWFERLKTENRSQLIVDLRQNGGGSDDAQAALLRHLVPRDIRLASALLTRFNSLDEVQRQYLSTWESAALYPDPAWFEKVDDTYYKLLVPQLTAATRALSPAANAFAGELIVLIGPRNSSGATHLIAALRASGRATLVGERTGGAATGATAGMIFFLTLPGSGIRIRVPAIRTVLANAEQLPARNGVEPDMLVPMTAEAFFAGQDPALDAAKRLLNR